ncbi:MAG: hypothetical protein HQ521_05980 [Bacteroidetes bacterium]|nr:hypothetical protein [Bacteroidota bacterium]
MVRIIEDKIVIEIETRVPHNALWLLKTSLLEVIGRAASVDDLGIDNCCFSPVTDFLQELELDEKELKKAFPTNNE